VSEVVQLVYKGRPPLPSYLDEICSLRGNYRERLEAGNALRKRLRNGRIEEEIVEEYTRQCRNHAK
jgi:hypothetical protein